VFLRIVGGLLPECRPSDPGINKAVRSYRRALFTLSLDNSDLKGQLDVLSSLTPLYGVLVDLLILFFGS
jgi:hypothetical protein